MKKLLTVLVLTVATGSVALAGDVGQPPLDSPCGAATQNCTTTASTPGLSDILTKLVETAISIAL